VGIHIHRGPAGIAARNESLEAMPSCPLSARKSTSLWFYNIGKFIIYTLSGVFRRLTIREYGAVVESHALVPERLLW
jgi:hypothetical protein